MKFNKKTCFFPLLIIILIIFLIILTHPYMKNGFIMNYTNEKINGDTVFIQFENQGFVSIKDIEKKSAVKFSKRINLIPQRITAFKTQSTKPVSDFTKPIDLGNVKVHFSLSKNKYQELYGIYFTDIYNSTTDIDDLVTVNFSKWILPVFGIIHSKGDLVEYKLILNNDVDIINKIYPDQFTRLKLINIFDIVKQRPIDDVVGGPNAVIGVEIGESVLITILRILYMIFLFSTIILSIFQILLQI